MMKGKITDKQEAIIKLKIIGPNHSKKTEALIDTGFSGFLCLPSEFIHHLKLPRFANQIGILGDGSTVNFDVYRAKVLWHGTERNVYVHGTAGTSLVGMALLKGNRLTLDIVTDGDVTITVLPQGNRG